MPVNKGLLFGAAVANGLNAFLDAREKGDLQRQRQAMVDFDKQMKTMQMEQAQQRIDLGKGQLAFDYQKLLTDAAKPPKLTGFQEALDEAGRAFDFEVGQGRLEAGERDQYLYDHMKQKGFVYDSSLAEAEKAKNLNVIDPLVSIEEAERYAALPTARRSDLIGLSEVTKKVQFDTANNRIIVTDLDGTNHQIIDLPKGDSTEARGKAVDTALQIRKSELGSSNMYLRNHVDIQSNYQTLSLAVDSALNEPRRVKARGGKENYVAIDQTITTAFIKMLDPGSVVREQEYARLLADMGISERFIGKAGNLAHGGYLTNNTRLAVARMGKKILQASELSKVGQHIIAYEQAVEAAKASGLSEAEAERYGALASGSRMTLSDGTTFDFKEMTGFQLVQLHEQKKEEWLGKKAKDWEDFRLGELGKDIASPDKSLLHKVEGVTFNDLWEKSVRSRWDSFNRLTTGFTSFDQFKSEFLGGRTSPASSEPEGDTLEADVDAFGDAVGWN